MFTRRSLLGLLVSLAFVLLFLRQVDTTKIVEAMGGANPAWLLAGVPVYAAGVWCRTLRWQALMNAFRPAAASALLPYVVIGYMANNLLPARAGEVVRAYLAGSRLNLAPAPILGTIALERVSDGLALLAFMAAAAIVYPLAPWVTGLALAMTVVFLAALGAMRLALSARAKTWGVWMRMGRYVPAKLREPAVALLSGVTDGLGVLQQPRLLVAVALYALVAWAWEAGVFYLVGLALHLDIPPVAYVLAMCTANLATALPSSQAGIGPFEFFCAETLVLYGVAPAPAAAYALLVHLVLVLPITCAGLAYLVREHLPLASLMQRSAAVAPRVRPS